MKLFYKINVYKFVSVIKMLYTCIVIEQQLKQFKNDY